MTRPIPEAHPLHRLFRGLTEHAFLDELGIGDPKLVGYVAALLVRFVPMDEVFALRDGQGRRLRELTAMLAEAESAHDSERRRECHRHVGDFALFWTGVFPEALQGRAARQSAEALVDYRQQGKRSYYLASTYASDDAPVLRRLSAEFELCALGLARVRREWEALPGGP
jgi:hypothetical protein